ncbi:MAG: DUF3276 family protein [Spirochaetes bacterium]|nr:DUF3276 family protein [Spirochaetota bacterium]
MNDKKKNLFSKQFHKGTKTYKFEVKESIKEELYIVINETTNDGEITKYSRVFIFPEAIDDFMSGLSEAIDYLRSQS